MISPCITGVRLILSESGMEYIASIEILISGYLNNWYPVPFVSNSTYFLEIKLTSFVPSTPTSHTLKILSLILRTLYFVVVDNPDIIWGVVVPNPTDGW